MRAVLEQFQRAVIDPRFEVLHFAPFTPPDGDNWFKAVELFMKEVVPALKTEAKS